MAAFRPANGTWPTFQTSQRLTQIQDKYYPIPIQFVPQDFQFPKEDLKHLEKLKSGKWEEENGCVTETAECDISEDCPGIDSPNQRIV